MHNAKQFKFILVLRGKMVLHLMCSNEKKSPPKHVKQTGMAWNKLKAP